MKWYLQADFNNKYAKVEPYVIGPNRAAFNLDTTTDAIPFEFAQDSAGICRLRQFGTTAILITRTANGPASVGTWVYLADPADGANGGYAPRPLSCTATQASTLSCVSDSNADLNGFSANGDYLLGQSGGGSVTITLVPAA